MDKHDGPHHMSFRLRLAPYEPDGRPYQLAMPCRDRASTTRWVRFEHSFAIPPTEDSWRPFLEGEQ